MASGCSLTEAVPSDSDYDCVEDEEVKRILKIIFDERSTVKMVGKV